MTENESRCMAYVRATYNDHLGDLLGFLLVRVAALETQNEALAKRVAELDQRTIGSLVAK